MSNFLTDMSQSRWLLVLALIAIVVRLPWVLVMDERELRFDEVAYVSHAKSLNAGQGYVDHRGARSSFWPVGYPAFLALAYSTPGVDSSVGIGLQIILLTLICLVTSAIAERSFGARIGRTAALLLAIYPNYIFYSTLMLSEPLCTLLLVLMTGLLLQTSAAGRKGLAGYSVATGILAGLVALVRPGFLFLPVLLPFWGRAQKMGWRRIVILTLIVGLTSLLVMAPWMIRNYNVTGAWFEIASNGGLVFWGGNHPDALGGVLRPDAVYTDIGAWTAEYQSSLGYRLGIESILSDIPAALRRSVQKLSYFFAIETDGAMWNFKGLEDAGRGVLPVLFAGLAYIAVVMSGIFALMHGLGNKGFGYWFLLLSAYSIAIAVVFEADPRYHFPLMPFFMVYAAAGMISYIPASIRMNRGGQLRIIKDTKIIYWSAAMVVFFLLIVFNLWLKTQEGIL